MAVQVQVRRIHEPVRDDDGRRVLVDRLWPRGIAKRDAALDEWLRRVAPSAELRRWYGHDPERFDDFRERYLAELEEPDRREALEELRRAARQGPVTLLTATRGTERSHAAVLADELRRSPRDA